MTLNENFYSHMVEESAIRIFVIRRTDLGFIYGNKYLLSSLGYSLTELKNLCLPELSPNLNKKGLNELLKEAETTIGSSKTLKIEACLHRRDGSDLPVELQLQAAENDGEIKYIAYVSETGQNNSIGWNTTTTLHDSTDQNIRERELQQFRMAADISYNSITILDCDSMRLLYVNRAVQKHTGYSEEELLNMPPSITLNIDPKEYEEFVNKVINLNGKELIENVNIQKKDGSRLHFELKATAFNLDGRWILITISNDVSIVKEHKKSLLRTQEELERRVEERTLALREEIEQRRKFEINLKLSEERFRDLAIASADGFWETNENLEFININKPFLTTEGVDPGRFNNLFYCEVSENIDDAEAEERNKYLNNLNHHKPFRDFQFKYKQAEYGYRYLSLSGVPVFATHGEFRGYRGASTDVTAQVEAAQQSTTTQLELHAAKDEFEKANRVKGEFLASMSHELRTPLNCILGFAQLLELSEKNLSEEQLLHIRHILSSGEHLLSLVTDLLELNAIEEGRMQLQLDIFSVDDLLRSCIDLVQLRAGEKKVSIVNLRTAGESLPMLTSDVTRLKQLLLNLLSNAIKYNKEGGTVTISCEKIENNMLRISVADTGSGIPENCHKDLFTPFERLGRETGQIEGTGIGLTIAKRVIELLNGRIDFESEPGKGSIFWIDIPIDQKKLLIEKNGCAPKINSSENPGEEIEVNSSRKVLYIEDDPDNQSLMKHILQRLPTHDIKLHTAHNAELGLDLARIHSPEAILMDINLPGMNGIEAVIKLKNIEETRAIPVIAISADATPHAIEIAMNSGFEGYITKPIKVQEIQQTVTRLLQSAESA